MIRKKIITKLFSRCADHVDLFLNKYNIIFDRTNYFKAIQEYLLDLEKYNKGTDNFINLIHIEKYDVYILKYVFNGQSERILINCDSPFKLRFFVYNQQSGLIIDFKKLCKFQNWKYTLFNDNQIIPQDIWHLITDLDNDYNILLKEQANTFDTSPEDWNKVICRTALKYDVAHIYSKDEKFLQESDSEFKLIKNRIIKNKLLTILKNQHINI